MINYFFDLIHSEPLAGQGIWMPSLFLFSVWAVVLRLIVSSSVQRNIKYRSWLVISHKGLEQNINDFHKLDPQGKFSILTARLGSALERSRNHYITHVDSIYNLEKYLSKIWSGVIVTHPDHLSDREPGLKAVKALWNVRDDSR